MSVAPLTIEPTIVHGADRDAARAAEWTTRPGEGGISLTWRERDVLALLCQRQTNAEIAARLVVSARTVETHVANILDKLGAANRREAGAIAFRRGLV